MLQELAAESDAWMIGLTESHLTEDVLDGEIKMAGYQISGLQYLWNERWRCGFIYKELCSQATWLHSSLLYGTAFFI